MGCCLYPPSLFLFRLQLLLSALLFLIPWAVQLGQLASLIGYQLKGCSYRAKLYDSGVSHLEAHLMRAHGFGCPRWEACLEFCPRDIATDQRHMKSGRPQLDSDWFDFYCMSSISCLPVFPDRLSAVFEAKMPEKVFAWANKRKKRTLGK